MSKKNKYKNFFMEEEDAAAKKLERLREIDDIIYGRENIKGSIFDISKIDDSKVIMENGLNKAVNDAIFSRAGISTVIEEDADDYEEDNYRDMEDDDDDEYSKYLSIDDSDSEEDDDNSSDDETENEDLMDSLSDDDVEEADDVIYMRSILFTLIPEFNRLIINDGIVPTSFSYVYALDQVLNQHKIKQIIDESQCANIYDLLLDYIITLKHPSAIYTIEEFEQSNAFKLVEEYGYDSIHYKFYLTDKYILAYYIDPDRYSEFGDYFTTLDMDDNQIIQTLVSIAFDCGLINNAFFVEETSYLGDLYNSNYNYKHEFEKLFASDEDNLCAYPYGSDDNNDHGIIYNMIEIVEDIRDTQINARELLTELTGGYFGDEDEDDDDESDEEYESLMDEIDSEMSLPDDELVDEEEDDDETDTEEDDENDETDDESFDLLGDDLESVDTESSNDLIAVVHRKTDK